jgi:hypothetical protein
VTCGIRTRNLSALEGRYWPAEPCFWIDYCMLRFYLNIAFCHKYCRSSSSSIALTTVSRLALGARDRRAVRPRPDPARPRPPWIATSPSSDTPATTVLCCLAQLRPSPRPPCSPLFAQFRLCAPARRHPCRPLWPLQRHVLCSTHDALSSIRLGHRREREDV